MNADLITMNFILENSVDELNKALPPKIAYRMRAWFKKLRPGTNMKQAQQTLTQKFEEALMLKQLQKSQSLMSLYKSADGHHSVVQMDFGAEVPSKVKEMAIKWAKKHGLKPVEMSMAKSGNVSSTYIFAADASHISDSMICYKREIL